MSVISAGNTIATSLIYTGDTTGNLVFTTGGANTTAFTLSNTQAATFANGVTVTGNVAVSSMVSASGALVLASNGTTTAVTIGTSQTTAFSSTILEQANAAANAMGANVTFDVITNPILYFTANATANSTINFRGNSVVTMNALMANNQSLSVVFMNTNGATAYLPTVFQVDGSAVVPKWQGGTAPTSGNTVSIDTYAFTFIKTANATYTVLASQTQFK